MPNSLRFPRLSVFYKLSLVLVLGFTLLLPLFYLALPVAMACAGAAVLVGALPRIRGLRTLLLVLAVGVGLLETCTLRVCPHVFR